MTAWRKSTWSDDYGNCVELAVLPHAIAIRDSKAPGSSRLALTPHTFSALLAHLKSDDDQR